MYFIFESNLNDCHRSPSPEPIYSSDGKRLNTREYRTRKRLEEERHHLIQQMLNLNPDFKPPADYKYVIFIGNKRNLALFSNCCANTYFFSLWITMEYHITNIFLSFFHKRLPKYCDQFCFTSVKYTCY